VRFLTSHLGYSPGGQVITWGSFPAALAMASVASTVDGLGHWMILATGFLPAIVWLVGKALGPERWPWFYRQPGTCTFSPAGLDWTTEMISAGHEGHIDWHEIAGVERRHGRLAVVGRDDAVVDHVRSDLYRLRPIGRQEDWSFAQALVSYRPQDYVLTDLVLYKMPAGARRRERGERESEITPQPLSRAPQVAMALYIGAIALIAIVQAFIRH
jgi:hypothetical protein